MRLFRRVQCQDNEFVAMRGGSRSARTAIGIILDIELLLCVLSTISLRTARRLWML